LNAKETAQRLRICERTFRNLRGHLLGLGLKRVMVRPARPGGRPRVPYSAASVVVCLDHWEARGYIQPGEPRALPQDTPRRRPGRPRIRPAEALVLATPAQGDSHDGHAD
jgi:hypothetical protein